jgi:sugar/nucleoside kinase (ribokinase family)
MSKKFDAVCIGLAVQDILLTGVRSDALSRDTTYANDCLVTSGGDANNQAITLGRLGDKVAPVFCISCDPIGESVYTALRNEPLNLSFIIRKPDAQMALSVVVVDPDGNRSFICRRGNKAFYLGREDIHDDMLSNTKIVTIGSLYSLPGLDGPPVADILK